MNELMLAVALLVCEGLAALAVYSYWLTATGRLTISRRLSRVSRSQIAVMCIILGHVSAVPWYVLAGHWWPVK